MEGAFQRTVHNRRDGRMYGDRGGEERAGGKDEVTGNYRDGNNRDYKENQEKKAAGEDGITNEAWMIGENELREDLRNIFNEIWKRGEIPKEWKIGTIKPIHKKGDKKEVGNYRGITLMDTGYKIYAEIVRKRLEKELTEKKVLDDTQMGYREGKGTAEAIYVLKELVR